MNKGLTKEELRKEELRKGELRKEELRKTAKKGTRGNRRRRRAYRFTLDTSLHKDLIEFLEGAPRVFRGGYCIEGLRLLKERMSPRPEERRTIDFKKLLK